MFGTVALDRKERASRFIEEAIELCHAVGLEDDVILATLNRVYERPRGDLRKEIGQAQATLETFAENEGMSSEEEAQREWARVRTIPQGEWKRRHDAKVALGIASNSSANGGQG
jgi:hypothetical protein